MKRYLQLFLCVALVFLCFPLFAGDFGLILDQKAGYAGAGSEGAFDYSGVLIPRFSTLLGDNASLYVSAGAAVEYKDEVWTAVPELLRTEFVWDFGSGDLTLGRMYYSDPLGLAASGLFDGAELSLDAGGGTFNAGAWYTGFLYKRRANISMTEGEQENNIAKTEYNDFFDTYFASKRAVTALGWEHPGLGELLRLNLALLGQFDLSGENLHSQYFVGKASVPAGPFVFSLGGSVEVLEQEDDIGLALAGELGAAWSLPTALEDRLSFLGIFTSGVVEDSPIKAFLPLTTRARGEIVEAKLSGLSVLALDYTARIHRTLSASLISSYFVRSDLATYTSYGPEGYFVGNEFFGRVLWAPVSDLQFNLGGGVFLPSLGTVAPEAEPKWRVELSAILALY